MKNMVWLSTLTSLRVCSSVANAVAIGNPGDTLLAHDREANAPAALPSYRIVASRSGKKRAVRLTPARRPCGCGGACMLCDDNGMVPA